jgi:3-oxoadipate enol-lactonase/3-oxoadipate enol-lactonase/4-carboxymuconolactone decarboxylase
MLTRQVPIPGVDLALAEAGGGGRPLLLVHGFAGAKEDFTDWLDPLASKGWHAVAYDQRGHGQSGDPATEEDISLAVLGDDLLALADALGWGRFVLLGHSMGGMVAQLVALRAPERLRALVLMDTGHGPPDGIDQSTVALGAEVVRQGGMAGLVEAQRAAGPSPLETPAHLRLVGQRPEYGEWCEAKTLAASPEMWLAISGEIVKQPDRLEALAALRLPVLVMVGEQDRAFLRQSQAMAAAIPGARLAIVRDGGHSPQFESSDEWWLALTTFLEEVTT